MSDFLQLLVGNTLTRVVFFPTVAALPLLLFRADRPRPVKRYLLVVSSIELLFVIGLVASRFVPGGGLAGLRDLGRDGAVLEWIPYFGIRYDLALDGVSMPLVVLTALLLPVVVLGSWRGIESQWRAYGLSLLVLTTGILGALTAMDLFLFYVFWEVMLVPMYLVIGIWGGERRIYAAIKFFLFTMVGSLLMLVGILWMAWTYYELTGVWSFGYQAFLELELPLASQLWLFAAFALAFAIKVPMFPLHTWLPDAHVEAPTGGSVILAGVLLKLGTYGFLRFALPFFPHASREAAPLLGALAVVGILYGALVAWAQEDMKKLVAYSSVALYGALVAWAQEDMKKLVAYSSVAHLGFVMLGLVAVQLTAWEGALIQMVNHGLSTGALFLLVGMLYDRRHTKLFDDYGGLARVMPWFAFFLVFTSLASVGLPGLNGFVGEFLILLGSWRAGLLVATIAATFGVVLAAVYLLKLVLRTVWGPLTREENRHLSDLSLREIVTLAPLCALMLAIGVAPEPFLARSRPALERTLAVYEQRLARPLPERAALAAPRLVETVTVPAGEPEEAR